MSRNDDEALLASITEIAEKAGEAILVHYAAAGESGDAQVREKDDASPVTVADEAAEAVILAALAALTPEIPVVAEEAFAAGKIPDVSAGRFWLVDPLDGTREYISRNGEFTVNIGLIEDGRSIAGVVHAPALGRSWTGRAGGGAFFREAGQAPSAIRARALPADGVTVIASRRHGSGEQLEGFLADYQVKERISSGSSLKFCLVASGKADLYPRFGRTMEWDTAAAHAVLSAAGGRVETVEGAPLTYGKPGFENPFFIAKGLG